MYDLARLQQKWVFLQNNSGVLLSPGFVQRGLLHLQVKAVVLGDHLDLGPHVTLIKKRVAGDPDTRPTLSGVVEFAPMADVSLPSKKKN